MAVLIGIDVGTTHLKAAAFSLAGEQLAVATVATPTDRLPDGGAQYDPEAVWQGVAACLAQVTAKVPGPVAGVGIASMAEAGVLVGQGGEPLYPAIAWFDPRTRGQAEALAQRPGREQLFQRTGQFLMPKFGLLKLLWIKENHPDLHARATGWLSMAEWIGLKLTGRPVSCPTLAARTLGYDLTAGRWMADQMAELGIRPVLFGEILPEGAAVGGVTVEAAALTGLTAGTPVGLAGHDHPAAALAAGVTQPGQMLDSTGTAEAVIGAISRPLLTPAGFASQISQGPLPVPGLYGLQAGASASGGSLEWLKRELFPGAEYADLTGLAEATGEEPTGLFYLPHLAGGGPPAVDPLSRGALVGLGLGTTRGAIVKAVLEGTAYELRRMVTAMEELVGAPFTRLVVTGGHLHNPLWLQLKADILGRELVVPEVAEATLLGAALLGGVAGGLFPDARAAAGGIACRERLIRPRPGVAQEYDRLYRVYTELAPALRPLYHAAAER